MTDLRELRLRYSAEGVADLIGFLDAMNLGLLPERIAILLALASDVNNWHTIEGEAV